MHEADRGWIWKRSEAGGAARGDIRAAVRVSALAALAVLSGAPAALGCPIQPGPCPGSTAGPERSEGLAPLGESDWQRLLEGEVVLDDPGSDSAREGNGGAILVDAPPESVWEVLTDFADWPRFLPYLEHSEIRDDDRGLRVRQRMGVMWARFEYTAGAILDPEERWVRVVLDDSEPSDLERLESRFVLTPLEGGRRTLLRMHTILEAGGSVPAFVKRALARRALPRSLEALSQEVESRDTRLAAL